MDYRDYHARIKVNVLSLKTPSTSVTVSIKTLMIEIEPVLKGNYEFDCRENRSTFVNFGMLEFSCKDQNRWSHFTKLRVWFETTSKSINSVVTKKFFLNFEINQYQWNLSEVSDYEDSDANITTEHFSKKTKFRDKKHPIEILLDEMISAVTDKEGIKC